MEDLEPQRDKLDENVRKEPKAKVRSTEALPTT